jgi:H+/Cl- antiporter ClcA
MGLLEDFLVGTRNQYIDSILGVKYGKFAAWSFLMGWCIVLAGTAAFITINIGPGAMGSGVPELMAYLNGVNYPKLISFQTFIVKTICVVLAITTNLFIGKEGPLAHIGANIGVLVIYYVPIKVFKYF